MLPGCHRAHYWLCIRTRSTGRDWQERFAAMTKKRRVYQPRVVGGQIMIQDDLERLHKNMLEHIADE
jgi:hypothetical protein